MLKALDNKDKFNPGTNFKGWMYTIMRNIFINNYRKTVRDQTFVDQTDNLFHLNFSQESGFDSTEGAYDLKRNSPCSQCFAKKTIASPLPCMYQASSIEKLQRSWDYH